jgi:hypothetical protein
MLYGAAMMTSEREATQRMATLLRGMDASEVFVFGFAVTGSPT